MVPKPLLMFSLAKETFSVTMLSRNEQPPPPRPSPLKLPHGATTVAAAAEVAAAALKAEASAHADAVMPAIREAQAAGAKSLRQIAAALNSRGIATARGGK